MARQWNVGAVSAVTPLGGGSINGAHRVEAQAGCFHLRVYREAQRLSIEREHAVIAAALAAGSSTPRPVPLKNGGTIGQLGCAWAALFERAPGAVIAREALTALDVERLGGFLADLHARLPQTVAFEVPRVGTSRGVERGNAWSASSRPS
ncbi:phosphotransferase [Deinococcus radiopugnans]|uniref:phosphotransferase n=1 Tax=Deinococcus radiopugnans TaxID=57497 RepID=UPI00360F8A62